MTIYGSFVIVAAGRGERFGHQAKVLLPIGGKPMLHWSLDAAMAASTVRDLVVVAGPHTIDDIRALVNDAGYPKAVDVVLGGKTRTESVAAGLAVVDSRCEVVLVHDAARPLVTPALIDRCAAAAFDHGSAIAAMPVTDTLKYVTDRSIDHTVSREHLWAAQTPQAFRLPILIDAFAWASGRPAAFTDEASILESMGQGVAIVDGAATNIKVTHPQDIALADALLAARAMIQTGRLP